MFLVILCGENHELCVFSLFLWSENDWKMTETRILPKLSNYSLCLDNVNAEAVLMIVRENKVFLELTAIDLDVDSAFELAQVQRQLSQWHVHWLETWANDSGRLEISSLAQTWANRIQQRAGVLV